MPNPSDAVVESSSCRFARLGFAWPVLGVLSAVFIAYKIGRWAASGVARVTPGHDTMPTVNFVLMRVLEWGQLAVGVTIIWVFVLRPLVRRQPLRFDGLFVLSAVLLNFWDVLDNYWVFAFQYNAYQLNVGSWAGLIPGWRSPDPQLWVVPMAFVLGAYTWGFFVTVRMGNGILGYLRRRHPKWGWVRSFGAVFVANAAVAAIAENVYLRIGAIANIRPYEALTLWDGTPHAFPLYNPILFSLTWTALAALRWSRDDRGLSFVERSIGDVVQSARTQAVLRFFAIFAFMEVAYVLLYFLPFNVFASMRSVPPNVFPTYLPAP